jgi:hypothetical protein
MRPTTVWADTVWWATRISNSNQKSCLLPRIDLNLQLGLIADCRLPIADCRFVQGSVAIFELLSNRQLAIGNRQ